MALWDADPRTLLSRTFVRIFSDPIKIYQIKHRFTGNYGSSIQADMKEQWDLIKQKLQRTFISNLRGCKQIKKKKTEKEINVSQINEIQIDSNQI